MCDGAASIGRLRVYLDKSLAPDDHVSLTEKQEDEFLRGRHGS